MRPKSWPLFAPCPDFMPPALPSSTTEKYGVAQPHPTVLPKKVEALKRPFAWSEKLERYFRI